MVFCCFWRITFFLNILGNRKNHKKEERRSVVGTLREVHGDDKKEDSRSVGSLSRVHGDEKVRIVERWLNVKERQDIRDSEYAKTHFVTYRNLGGFNNRLEALEMAFLFAVLLNRTLLVHPFSASHTMSGGKVAPEQYFDMKAFQWPIKQWNDVDFAKLQSRSIRLHVGLHPCGMDIDQLCEDMRKTSYSDIPMILAHDSRDGKSPYPWWPAIFAKQYHQVIRSFFTKYVRFNPSLCDFTRNSLQSQTWLRQPYAAMHFRLGDRPGLQLANCSLFGFRFQGHFRDIKKQMSQAEIEAIRYGCNKPSAEDPKNHVIPLFTEDVVGSWHLPENIKVLYIATNRPNDLRVKKVKEMFQKRGLTTLTWENLDQTLAPKRDETGISIQEQCGLAKCVVFSKCCASRSPCRFIRFSRLISIARWKPELRAPRRHR